MNHFARRLTVHECLAILFVTFGVPRGHEEIRTYGLSLATPQEIAPWFNHGFNFVLGNPFLDQPFVGPCGVLAVVQSYIFLKLIYGVSVINAPVNDDVKHVSPGGSGEDLFRLSQYTFNQMRDALAEALAFMIWQAATVPGAHKVKVINVARLVTLSTQFVFLQQGIAMQLIETTYESYAELLQGVLDNIDQFRSGSGILLLIFSMIQSRTVEFVFGDRDEALSFVERSGHMSQALINIGISGQAVQNCFNGIRNIGGLISKGIHKMSLLGCLYHSEDVGGGHLVIGSFLMNPSFPLFACCNGYHTTAMALLNPLYTLFPLMDDPTAILRQVNVKLFLSYFRYLNPQPPQPPQFVNFLNEFQCYVGYKLKQREFNFAIGQLLQLPTPILFGSVEDIFKKFVTFLAQKGTARIRKETSSSVILSPDGGVRFINLIRWDGLSRPLLTRFVLGADDFINPAQSNDEAMIRTRHQWDHKEIFSWAV